MTDDRMALLELIEKDADGDLVREMLAFAAERLMELEIEAATGLAVLDMPKSEEFFLELRLEA